jgi:putative FmdB family regulatory protein
MPLYEYLCVSCGHRFERIQKFSDAPLTECPSCGGKVEKQISSPAIQFKGSGWYINDYAKAGKSESKSSGSTAEGGADAAKADKPAESKSEKAPAATEASAAKPASPAPNKS